MCVDCLHYCRCVVIVMGKCVRVFDLILISVWPLRRGRVARVHCWHVLLVCRSPSEPDGMLNEFLPPFPFLYTLTLCVIFLVQGGMLADE